MTSSQNVLTPDGLELHPCGGCGGYFPMAGDDKTTTLFGHPCAGDVSFRDDTPASWASVDAPEHGSGSAGHSVVRPPTNSQTGLLAALVRGAAFAAMKAVFETPSLADLELTPEDAAVSIETLVPVEVVRLSGHPASAVRVSKALDDFKAGGTKPLWRPITAANLAPSPASAAPSGAPVRANKFGGKCAICGAYVEAGVGRLSKDSAGAWIVLHLEGACVEQDPQAPSDEAHQRGAVHVVGDDFIRVHISQSSGYPYAVKVRVIEPAVWDGDVLVEAGVIEWERVPGMIAKLTPATLATAEQAAAFGKLVGRCCFCSTPIDTPESTAVGYGPKCAAKYGLPWG